MQPLSWKIGTVTITPIIEIDAGEILQNAVPNAVPEKVKVIPSMIPSFIDNEGTFKGVIQSFIIKTDNKTIIVDTCNGNHKHRTDIPEWNNLHTDFMHRLADAGYSADTIDTVVCTHLHCDHAGGNTILKNDTWIPAFPHAEYIFVEKEYAYWRSRPKREIIDDHRTFTDSVQPIFDAGQAMLVPANYALCPEVTLSATHGHTPGHVSVVITSQQERAVITGDVFMHPCQITYPEWSTPYDTDSAKADEARKQFLETYTDTDVLIIGTHFAPPTAGYIVSTDAQRVFVPAEHRID